MMNTFQLICCPRCRTRLKPGGTCPQCNYRQHAQTRNKCRRCGKGEVRVVMHTTLHVNFAFPGNQVLEAPRQKRICSRCGEQ